MHRHGYFHRDIKVLSCPPVLSSCRRIDWCAPAAREHSGIGRRGESGGLRPRQGDSRPPAAHRLRLHPLVILARTLCESLCSVACALACASALACVCGISISPGKFLTCLLAQRRGLLACLLPPSLLSSSMFSLSPRRSPPHPLAHPSLLLAEATVEMIPRSSQRIFTHPLERPNNELRPKPSRPPPPPPPSSRHRAPEAPVLAAGGGWRGSHGDERSKGQLLGRRSMRGPVDSNLCRARRPRAGTGPRRCWSASRPTTPRSTSGRRVPPPPSSLPSTQRERRRRRRRRRKLQIV